jgi:predicted ribosomally synthesized six-cysteine peptide SCIFF
MARRGGMMDMYLNEERVLTMKKSKRIVTLSTRDFTDHIEHDGCGECQTSCQSACKTSCGVVNQACERKDA